MPAIDMRLKNLSSETSRWRTGNGDRRKRAAARGASEGCSLHPSHRLAVYRGCLSATASPTASAEMHTGGWRDVAVDAEMQLGIEPSSAVKIVVRAITVTLRTLRECSRGCAQQQRH